MKNNIQSFIVYGDPIPQQRPRFSSKSKSTYDPNKKQKKDFALQVRMQHKGHIFTVPLRLDVVFGMPCPKKLQKRVKDGFLLSCQKRPDIDNLLKFLMDSLNGLIYDDDALIAIVTAQKIYSLRPYTKFSLTPLEEK